MPPAILPMAQLYHKEKPVVLYGCETWFLTPREEHTLRVIENRVLWRIFGPKRQKWQEYGEEFIIKGFRTSTLHQILLGE
jgi:hypothetical protein